MAHDDGLDELLAFLRAHSVAVQTSVSPERRPQAALVAYVMGDGLEILFDTLPTSRKLANLRSNPAVAFVIGGWAPGERRSVQYEGVADEPSEPDLTRFKAVHFGRPAASRGVGDWAEVVYVRVRPTWIRFADFSHHPPLAVEFTAAALGRVTDRARTSSR